LPKYIGIMKTHLDKFGRIVIPHAMREDMGLKPGDPLEVSWTGSEIRIKPAVEESPMVLREGILIYDAGSEEGVIDSSLEEERRRRMRKILESDQD
jgi:AbrB family looped-hinge helix DNA binding protein